MDSTTVELVFPKGAAAKAAGSSVDWLKAFLPFPVPFLAAAALPTATFIHLRLLKSLCIDDTPFRIYNTLRTRVKCDGCNGFEHEICNICDSRGLVPSNSEFARAMSTDFYLYKKTKDGPWRAKPEEEQIAEHMGALSTVLLGMPAALPCRQCCGEGVITCQQCKGNSKVLDPFPHLEIIANLPSRVAKVFQKVMPDGPPLAPGFWEALREKTAAQFWLHEQPFLKFRLELPEAASRELKETWKKWKTVEDRVSNVKERGRNWEQDLAALKQENPDWTLQTTDQYNVEKAKTFTEDSLRHVQALAEGPEVSDAPLQLMWAKQTKRSNMDDLFPEVNAERSWLDSEKKAVEGLAWQRFTTQMAASEGAIPEEGTMFPRTEWEAVFNRLWGQGQSNPTLRRMVFDEELLERKIVLDARDKDFYEGLLPSAEHEFRELQEDADVLLADGDKWQALAAVPSQFENLVLERRGQKYKQLLGKDVRVQRRLRALRAAKAAGRRWEVKRLERELSKLTAEITAVENAKEAERRAKTQLRNVAALAKLEAEEARQAQFAEELDQKTDTWVADRLRRNPKFLEQVQMVDRQLADYEKLRSASAQGVLTPEQQRMLRDFERSKQEVDAKWEELFEKPRAEMQPWLTAEVERRVKWLETEGDHAQRNAGKVWHASSAAKGKRQLLEREVKLEEKANKERVGRLVGAARGVLFSPVNLVKGVGAPVRKFLEAREMKKKEAEYEAQRIREEEERLRAQFASPVTTTPTSA